MDPTFLDSLLAAIADFCGSLAGTLGADGAPAGPSPWSSQLERIGDRPVTFGVPHGEGMAGIRGSDPDFDLAGFLQHVGEMFEAYHCALAKGDLTPVRRFVDEDFYAQLATATRHTQRGSAQSSMLTVRAIRPITARHTDELDLVRVFIAAEQSGSEEMLREYWELVRKRGTRTKPGLDITHCPNCGGPVDGLDPTRCAYCQTRLADPALDWVVRKISSD